MEELKNKRVTVAGLGRFGGNIAAAQWLVEQGASVLVTDKTPADQLVDSIKQLENLPIQYRLGEHREEDFTSADLVVASPAIPPTNKYLQAARTAGVPVTTEIRLFLERCPASVVGVTGTKGKSTTTALLGLMLKTKFTAWVGGNIGRSLLSDLSKIKKSDIVLLELSSFMLDYLAEIQWAPHVGLVTMLASDHIEWHGTQDAYLHAKSNLVRFQKKDDFAILNEDNELSLKLLPHLQSQVIFFGTRNRKPFDLTIPGQHNQLNAQAAFAAASVLGISWDDAQAAIRTFPGLPHRLQLVHESNGVRYYDDSIATIPDAAVAALNSFPPRKVIQIVGGHDKQLPFTNMCAALAERAKAVLCIGETAPKLVSILGQSPAIGAASTYNCGDLATAMTMAKKIAIPGDIVLLSTGCSSYDQFINFEHRGDQFATLARGV